MDRSEKALREACSAFTQTTINNVMPAIRIMELEQENAKLHNIEEGLKRLDNLLKDTSSPAGDICFIQKHRDGISIFDGSTEQSIYFAPTLADLIDKILTGGK